MEIVSSNHPIAYIELFIILTNFSVPFLNGRLAIMVLPKQPILINFIHITNITVYSLTNI
jgi:hypothetical protein